MSLKYKVVANTGEPTLLVGHPVEVAGEKLILYKYDVEHPKASGWHVDVRPNTWWATPQYAAEDYLANRKVEHTEQIALLTHNLNKLRGVQIPAVVPTPNNV